MPGIIHLLPDSVANQIAAGEVIQRPASVVKELMENAIDAGAQNIRVSVTDAGRTLVQVVDDGCGMSETDARLAFERHATSKITNATDLFALHTMGFRGEALASIAAVAQVELVTRRADDDLGIKIELAGSKLTNQEPTTAPEGSRFCVKNLFFNVPARRRFLKSDAAEMRHISTEFLRVALAHFDVTMSLTSNGTPLFMFPKGNMKQRVSAVAGKALSQQLLPIEVETSIATIRGFIGAPETAKKSGGDQYFFANERFMKHPYLHKAIMDAYKNIIAADLTPAYFIYITVDPNTLDVNIHPQKTEIKFEDDKAIWQILNAAVRECLGKFNIMPSIDFDTAGAIDIPPYIPGRMMQGGAIPPMPSTGDATYNPFEHENDSWQGQRPPRQHIDSGWQTLYSGIGNDRPVADMNVISSKMGSTEPSSVFDILTETQGAENSARFMQFNGRYIVTPVKSGLMFIDQHRAHERIRYNSLKTTLENGNCPSQKLIFPEIVPIGMDDACIIEEIGHELTRAGLEITYDAEAGQLTVTSIPAQIPASEIQGLIEAMIFDYRNGEMNVCGSVMEYVTRVLATHSALPYGKQLTAEEMSGMYDKLFSGSSPSLTPSGRQIFAVVQPTDIEAYFTN